MDKCAQYWVLQARRLLVINMFVLLFYANTFFEYAGKRSSTCPETSEPSLGARTASREALICRSPIY